MENDNKEKLAASKIAEQKHVEIKDIKLLLTKKEQNTLKQ